MASLTSAAVTIPNFTGLKSSCSAAARVAAAAAPSSSRPKASPVRASLRDHLGVAAAAAAASFVLATGSNALAAEVLLGGSDGTLAFVPSELTVKAGEKIVFKNNAGYPHNVVFDGDEVPSGVDAGAISMDEEALLNAAGEEYSVTLSTPGTYSYYCAPHQGAGMVGKITVN